MKHGPHLLLLIRHGKSSWKDGTLLDFDRPLKPRGQEDALRLGTFLQVHFPPDLIVSSTAKRAVQTVEFLKKGFKCPEIPTILDERLYLCTQEMAEERIAALPESAETVAMIGHNPTWDLLLIHHGSQTPALPDSDKLMTTASCAALEIHGEWASFPHCTVSLRGIWRPADLINP
jgi:phosphohistidine phosphatase